MIFDTRTVGIDDAALPTSHLVARVYDANGTRMVTAGSSSYFAGNNWSNHDLNMKTGGSYYLISLEGTTPDIQVKNITLQEV
jgi:hypothetical protein